MSHFCKYCGKELQDGEVCSCEKSVAARKAAENFNNANANAAPNQSQYAAQNNNQYTVAPGAFQVTMNRWVSNTKKFIKSPATVSRMFVGNRQFKPAFIFMAIYSLMGAFLPMIFAKKVTNLIEGIISSITSLFSSGYSSIPATNLAEIYFWCAFATFAALLIFALFIKLFAKLFKCNMSYSHALAATGIYSITATPFILLGIILALAVSSALPFLLFILIIVIAAGKLLGFSIAVESLKDDHVVTNNNASYIVILAFAAFLLFALIFSSICISSAIQSLKDLGSLSNMSSLF